MNFRKIFYDDRINSFQSFIIILRAYFFTQRPDMVNFYGHSMIAGFLVSLIPGPVIDYLGLRLFKVKKDKFFQPLFPGHRSLKTDNDESKGRRIGIAIFSAVTSVIGFIFSILHAQRYDSDKIGI